MSFILDALKKSESDRQRQSGPSLFEVKVAPPRRTLPVWAVVIAALLGINVIVISWMLLRHPAAQQPAAAGNAAAAAPPPATLVQAGGGAAPSAAPVGRAASGTERPGTASEPGTQPPATTGNASAAGPAAAEPPAASATGAVAELAGSRRTLAGSGQPNTTASPGGGADRSAGQPPAGDNPSDYAPAVQPAATSGSEAAGAGAGDLPLYQQIAANAGLPALHLDLHVFADRPQDRFVMINMHRVGEGDSLPSGVQVEAIRPDGVVLSYRGTRFLLPRN